MTKILTIILVLLAGTVVAEESSIDMSTLRFEALLQGTLGSLLIQGTVNVLAGNEDSGYLSNLNAGMTWTCIVQVLTNLVAAEEKAAVQRPEDPSGLDYSYLRIHSGHSWKFWLAITRFGQAVDELGDIEWLSLETIRVLHEMEDAFEPLLTPKHR
jgi:hypothetical protein